MRDRHGRTSVASRADALLADAAEFFERHLWDSHTTSGTRDWLAGRGLDEKTLREFGVGFAPVGTRELMDHLSELGYSDEEMLATGLADSSSRGRVHVRFRSRITFPVRDAEGRVQGFAALSTHLGPSWPMWVFSPDTASYQRADAVFGLDRAAKKIGTTRTALLRHDCLDVLLAHQEGRTNAVTVHSPTVTRNQMLAMAERVKGGIGALELDLPAGLRADDKHRPPDPEAEADQGPVRNLETAPPDAPHLKAKRLALVIATGLAAMNTWTGAPLLAVWVGSQAQGGKVLGLRGVVTVILVLGVLEFALALALTWLSAKYDELTGRPRLAGQTSPWHRAKRGDRVQDIRSRYGISAPEKVVAACVIAGVLALEIWFLFYAGAPF